MLFRKNTEIASDMGYKWWTLSTFRLNHMMTNCLVSFITLFTFSVFSLFLGPMSRQIIQFIINAEATRSFLHYHIRRLTNHL